MTRVMLLKPQTTHSCGYLPQQESVSLYVDPNTPMDDFLLSQLNLNGFRRSGRSLYRPDCPTCNACTSLRIPVDRFTPKRRFRKVLKRLQHWQLHVEKPSMRWYADYAHYIYQRHADGSMYPPSEEQFQDFLIQGFDNHRFLVATEQGQFRACLVFDVLMDGLSSVYCFYDPALTRESPGTFMILQLTRLTAALQQPHHYLGYWVPGCSKMEYKTDFQPLEQFVNGNWCSYSPG
ncbi:arginyltransferase [Oceanobacter sp. 5_MG-2023]|uniref:arginyltransferase n=1 Tax=Oceanobacter sp. 5_MG-2023 TaxID=3062645 RepID=UPI0026E33BE6|nr:arginyltransferase [Oceanobacter sp. 5_MG-2023]MDO6681079.1 arginyltransferase [Oceanobacter sp. 5_MG-2023]